MNAQPPDRPSRKRRLLRLSAFVLAPAAAFVGLYILTLELTGNVHEVILGEVYRSGQLSPSRLAQVAAKYGIRSVLNLRGPNPGKTWYDEEVASCSAQGITHIDVCWSALHDISPDRCGAVEQLIERAPKPLLLHCQAGADRSGLAASVCLLGHGSTPEVARTQLSIWYLHFPYFGSGTRAMDESFDRYADAVKDRTIGKRE